MSLVGTGKKVRHVSIRPTPPLHHPLRAPFPREGGQDAKETKMSAVLYSPHDILLSRVILPDEPLVRFQGRCVSHFLVAQTLRERG